MTAAPYALIAAGAVLRILPHPANLAPIGALALFGGAVLPIPWGFAVPIAALALSDLVLGAYPGMIWVYGSFILIALLGRAMLRHRTTARVVSGALMASILFFLLTNLGEWFGPPIRTRWQDCGLTISPRSHFSATRCSGMLDIRWRCSACTSFWAVSPTTGRECFRQRLSVRRSGF